MEMRLIDESNFEKITGGYTTVGYVSVLSKNYGEAVAEASGSSQMCSTAQPYGFGQLSVLSSVGINYDKPLDQLPLFGFPGSLARTMYLTVTKAIF
jgi:hypothetical protein